MKHYFLFLPSLFIFFVNPNSSLGGPADQHIPIIKEVINKHAACLVGRRDYGEFCNSDPRVCLGALVLAIVELESGGQSGKTFDESNYQKGMKDSVGLMQLSQGECKPEGDNLKDPRSNIACGVRKLCELVKKDNVIAQGKSGGAAYWSVLREPYNLSGAKGGIISVGKKSKIIKLTKEYHAKMQ